MHVCRARRRRLSDEGSDFTLQVQALEARMICHVGGRVLSKIRSSQLSASQKRRLGCLSRFWHWLMCCCCCSVAQSCPALFDRPQGLQHSRLPCPSLSPRVCSNSCPLSQWCHPTISSSVAPFSSCPQCFPASGSFPVSQLFVSSGQSIEVSVSASVLPMKIQDWFPLGWTGLLSLQFKGLSRVFSSTTVQKHEFFDIQPSLWSNS